MAEGTQELLEEMLARGYENLSPLEQVEFEELTQDLLEDIADDLDDGGF